MSNKEQSKEINVSSEIEIQYYNKVFENFYSDDDIQIQEDMFVGYVKVGKNMSEIILSNVCYPAQHFHGEDGKVKVEVVFKMGKSWKNCLFDLSVGKINLMKTLNSFGFLLIDNSDIAQQLFVRHFYNLLQFLLNNTLPSKLVNQVGWQNDECTSFVYGTKIINLTYDAKEKVNKITFGKCVLDDKIVDLEKSLSPRGDEKTFKDIIDTVFTSKLYKQQCNYLLGVSSPLLEIFGQNGCLINNYSQGSGYLKSQIQKLIHLTNFNESKIVNEATDTAIIENLRKYKNFCFCIEELTILMNEHPEKVRGLIYKIPSGISKLRSTVNSSNQQTNEFNNSVNCSANRSIYEMIPNDKEAEVRRCLEICYDNDIKDEEYENTMTNIYNLVNKIGRFNGGHGLNLIKKVMTVKDLQDQYSKNYDFFIKIYGDSNHRYTCAVVSTAYTMAEIMTAVGYKINLPKIKETFIEIINYNVEMQKNKITTNSGLIEKILSNVKVALLKKEKDNSIVFDSEITNSKDENYEAFIFNRNELIIPKEIFEKKLLNGTKLKPAILQMTFKEVQVAFKGKMIVTQRRFKGAKMNCLVIDIGDLIESKIQKVKDNDDYDNKSDQEHINDIFGEITNNKKQA